MRDDLQTDPLYQYNEVPAQEIPQADVEFPSATSFGTSLINVANAVGGRTLLGLGTISTQNANGVTITGGAITGITDLAVADGGTGASTAANARTNLGIDTIATKKSNLQASADPTVNDDTSAGYDYGSFWIRPATGRAWICTDPASGVAVWGLIT